MSIFFPHKWVVKMVKTLICKTGNALLIIKDVIWVILGLGGIIGITAFSILFVPTKLLAVMLSTGISCIFAVIVFLASKRLIAREVRSDKVNEATALIELDIVKKTAELERSVDQNKIKSLETENEEQKIKINRLSDKVKLLENAQLSVQKFEQILKVALLETKFKTTLVEKNDLGEKKTVKNLFGFEKKGEYTQDEVLVIQTCEIDAVFGIDLKKIKVSKDENAVVFSGFSPEPIGTPNCNFDRVLEETRTQYFKGGMKKPDKVIPKYDRDGEREAHEQAELFKSKFQAKVKESKEISCMDDAVIKLAQNFISVMFAPLYGNDIRFEKEEIPGALPIIEHIESEIKKNNELIEENNELIEKNNALIEDAQMAE